MTGEKREVPETVFWVPLQERFLEIGLAIVTCKQIDEVGLFIYHDGKQELTPEFVRHHLIDRRDTNCIIEAGTPEEAIKIFHGKWEGAKIGGKDRKSKALWIDEGTPICGLPECALRHKNREGDYICGEEIGIQGNGEFGMCVIENYDAPDDCSVDNFYAEYFDRQRVGTLPTKTVNVDGVDYPFVMAEDMSANETPVES